MNTFNADAGIIIIVGIGVKMVVEILLKRVNCRIV